MKFLVNFCRIVVGVLFIFSGLVKANDPLGLSYKMQEYFEVWGRSSFLHSLMSWLNDFALTFSIIMITFEIIVGLAILLGWGIRLFSWLLLLLMIFFTFLTGYAVLSGKIRTCGCFGDCIPLTAYQSFLKDIVLMILTLVIVYGTRYIKPLFKPRFEFLLILFSTALVISFQWYVLRHLPVVDCLPYKKGNNLLELRKMPANAVADKMDFKFIYKKNGEKKEFSKDQLPDSTWTFVKREDIILEKGENNEPPIKDLFLTTPSGSDTTEAVFGQPGEYYLFFIRDAVKDTSRWMKSFRDIYSVSKSKNKDLVVVASLVGDAQHVLNETNHFNVPVLGCDATAMKTASRTDPGLYLMKGAVVEDKWGVADLEKAVRNAK